MRVWNGGAGDLANAGCGRKTPRRSSAPSALRILTRRTQRDAEEKIEPVHHQDTKNTKEKRTLNYLFLFCSLRLSANATGCQG